MDKPLEEYLTISEASKILEVEQEIMSWLCENGKIKGAKKFCKTWIIPRSALKLIHVIREPKPDSQYILELNQALKKAIAQAKHQDNESLSTSKNKLLPNDDKYEPHDYLKRAISAMSAYRVSDGQVDIATPETEAIIAIMLYIINAEPKVSRTKLECYIILLNKLIQEATGKELFTWTLNKYRRISNFKCIFEHMIERGLLVKNGSARFFIPRGGWRWNIVQGLPIMLDDMLPYLDKLLARYDDYTAGEMLKEI